MDQLENFSTFSNKKFKFFYEKNLQLLYLRQCNACLFGQMGVSGNRPKLDQFWHFIAFSFTKLKFKEGILYEKIAISCNRGPMWRAVLVKPMAKLCQSNLILIILNLNFKIIFSQFYTFLLIVTLVTVKTLKLTFKIYNLKTFKLKKLYKL